MPPSNSLKIHFIIILPSTPKSSKWSLFPQVPTKIPHASLPYSVLATCPAHLILLILSPEEHLEKRKDHEAPRYVVFSIPVSSFLLGPNASSTPYSRGPSPFTGTSNSTIISCQFRHTIRNGAHSDSIPTAEISRDWHTFLFFYISSKLQACHSSICCEVADRRSHLTFLGFWVYPRCVA
jgi:hypothetical protein